MIARASQLFLPTLRDAPADADAASHQLLVRGGFIRQMGAGLWSFLPLGWRVHMRLERIIREEIDAIGGQEMRCPTLTPAELWETTGRITVPILFHLKDSGGRDVGFIYAHGRVLKKVSSDILIDELFHEIDKWIADGMHRPKRLKMAKPAALAMAEASLIPLE